MALRTYNNNDKTPTVSTYSSIVFSNPESKIMASRFSIGYFNKLMKISIALRNNAGSNDAYATYATDNQVSVYVSGTKAIMLAQMIDKMNHDATIKNVCIELKNGLLKVSNGSEYGTRNTCISISFADESGNVNEVVYETKGDYHTAAYNYNDGEYSTEVFNHIEIDTIKMTLEEYYRASSYAIAATVAESNMYRREATNNIIKAIAEKVGASTSSSGKQFNNKTFLSGGNKSSSSSSNLNGVPEGYEVASFDSIVSSM